MARTLTVVLVASLAAGTAQADRLTLKDGGVCEGRVVAETDHEITLEVLLSGKVVRVGLPADRVVARERNLSVLDAYEVELKKADPKSADAMTGLAAWCVERKWVERAETHLRAALLLEPDHALAGRMAASLGWSRDGNRWLTGPERLRELGLEPVGSQWVTRKVAAQLRKAEADRRSEASRVSEREGVAYHLRRADADLAMARRGLLEAQKAVEESDAKMESLEAERVRLQGQVESLKAREKAILREIARLEAWSDYTSVGGGYYGVPRAYVNLDPLYRELGDTRRERRDAERVLARVVYEAESCRLNRGVRREVLDKAAQTAAWRGAEVDRLRTRAVELDRKPVPETDPDAEP